MTDVRLILCTCGSEEEAERLTNALLEARLAACVSRLPEVLSSYRWQGAVEHARESLLLIKTVEQNVAAVQAAILAQHSYETPEVLVVPVTDGSASYLDWVRQETRETSDVREKR